MMKTCGDCIHADVCENRYSWLSQEDNTKRIICHHFKAKTDVAQQKWIPVTERLPERDELVLCVGKKAVCSLGKSTPSLWEKKEMKFIAMRQTVDMEDMHAIGCLCPSRRRRGNDGH